MIVPVEELRDWVDRVAGLTRPDAVHWCDGSAEELQRLRAELMARGELLPLNSQTFPGCYLFRSAENDVARVEHLTYVCTRDRRDAGPNNLWVAPAEAHGRMRALFRDCMRGRALYVVPYCMGPVDSPYARCGVELTDSIYVVLNMALMTRMGRPALQRIARDGKFVRGLHSVGDLQQHRRFIMHYPEESAIESFGSGYGGNALLSKKCHALRIASWQARDEGWLAEHMLLMAVENPAGETHYVAAAFPSACGKTNLAMLLPPASMAGWKVHTLGDDIAWLHPGADGRLWAINPEHGYFGVVPGTNARTNLNADRMIRSDTLYTNVALTSDNEPWWEGKLDGAPVSDWRGQPYRPENGPAAHPNSRFTVAADQNPSYSAAADSPQGVPISAIIFGGRRQHLAPLVFESRDWNHGVFVGASVASETTAAATGQLGVVRRDPMAMGPFAGYNFGDYWAHWLQVGRKLTRPPRIFHVNWFRQDSVGRFLWPGFGENLRVLEWILRRCRGEAGAAETPIGFVPGHGDLRLDGLDISAATLEHLSAVPPAAWASEMRDLREYLRPFGDRVPAEFIAQIDALERRIDAAGAANQSAAQARA